MKRFGVLSTLAIGSVLVATTGAAYGQLSGAIFTTTASGTTVNGNNYSLETDVYLDGGPQPNAPCTSSGLPDGNYYFQVTDPSGSYLLSNDAIGQREVTVSGGIITAYIPASTTGKHATSAGKCGSITVALYPFTQTLNPGNEYKVWMTPVGSYDATLATGVFGFLPSASKTDNFRVLNFTCTTDCPPPNPPTITGEKCYDFNLTGSCSSYTSNIVLIPGWKITSTDPNSNTVTTYTDSFGQYSFVVSPSTQYTIAEVMPNSTWIATSPTPGPVTSSATGDTAGPNFANVCVGAGGGLTLGFWSNKNGAKLLGTSPGLVNALSGFHLVNADGSSYTPALSTFSNWLLSANATNMAYMLSAQMATMQLNVSYGKVNGSAWVYAPGTPSANTLGFTTINQLISDANTNLASNPLVLAGNTDRVVQQALETALDNGNNNINFVQPGPSSCPFTY